MADFVKERDKKEEKIKKEEEKIDDIYDNLPDPDTTSQEQYVESTNSIN
jgi:hypothetical protein